VGAASSRDHTIITIERIFFRGWKPLPRKIDVKLMTLIPDLMKFHMSGAAGQKNGQSNQKKTTFL